MQFVTPARFRNFCCHGAGFLVTPHGLGPPVGRRTGDSSERFLPCFKLHVPSRADGMYNQGGGPAGAGRGMGGGRRNLEDITEGKLFLGGLDANTSTEALTDYCSGWYELQVVLARVAKL